MKKLFLSLLTVLIPALVFGASPSFQQLSLPSAGGTFAVLTNSEFGVSLGADLYDAFGNLAVHTQQGSHELVDSGGTDVFDFTLANSMSFQGTLQFSTNPTTLNGGSIVGISPRTLVDSNQVAQIIAVSGLGSGSGNANTNNAVLQRFTGPQQFEGGFTVTNNNPMSATFLSNTNTFQPGIVVQNKSSGIAASSEIDFESDNGSPTNNNMAIGINGSGFNSPGLPPVGTNTAYILVEGNPTNYANGATAPNLMIETAQTNSSINFSTGNGGSRTNVQISDSNFQVNEQVTSTMSFAAPNFYGTLNGSTAGASPVITATGSSANGIWFVRENNNGYLFSFNVWATNSIFSGNLVVSNLCYIPTNTAPVNETLYPTNSFALSTIYTNGLGRSTIQGNVLLTTSVGAGSSCTLFYTNNGTGHIMQFSAPLGQIFGYFIPFSVKMSTNSTFQFVQSTGTAVVTNVVSITE